MADEVEDVTILVNKLSQFSLPSISGTELEDYIRESLNVEGKESIRQIVGADVSELRMWVEETCDALEIALASQDCTTYLQIICERLSSRALLLLLHRCLQEDRNATVAGLAACTYLNLIRLPGSVSYQIFHPIMFRQALKNISAALKTSSNTDTKKKKKTKPKAKKRKAGDNGEDSFSGQSHNISQQSGHDDNDDQDLESTQSDNPKLTKKICDSAVAALCGLVSNFPLSAYPDSVVVCIETLVDLSLVKTEELMTTQRRRQSHDNSVCALSFKCLEGLLDERHGEPKETLRVIVKILLGAIFINFKTPAEFKELSDARNNAIGFIQKLGVIPAFSEPLTALIQHMCIKSPERAELRVLICDTVCTLLASIQPELSFLRFANFLRKLGSNTKMQHRLFSVELVSVLMDQLATWKAPEMIQQKDATLQQLLNLLWDRCSDKGTNIRSKALASLATIFTDFYLAGKLGQELSAAFLEDSSESGGSSSRTDMEIEIELDPETVLPDTTDSSGTFSKPILDVQLMLTRRLEDEKWSVRKSATQAYAGFIGACCKRYGCVNPTKLYALKERTTDASMSVRKQAISSLTELLLSYFKDNETVCGYWVSSTLPLILDTEYSMQEKCVEVFDEVVLKRLEARVQDESLWVLVSKIDEESVKYVQRILQVVRKSGRNFDRCIKSISNQLGPSTPQGVWRTFLELSAVSHRSVDVLSILNMWNETADVQSDHKSKHQQMILSVLSNCLDSLKLEDVNHLADQITGRLLRFEPHLEQLGFVQSMVLTLMKMTDALRKLSSESVHDRFSRIAAACEEKLYQYTLKGDQSADSIAVYLYTAGEISLVYSACISKRLLTFIQSLNAPTLEIDFTKYGDESTLHDSQTMTQHVKFDVPAIVRAHALVALGKFCLNDQSLAKKCIAAFARELQTTTDSIIRNNVIVILSDFCVKYASMVEPYVQHLAGCFKDSAPFLRKQSLILVTRLLQEDFLKWKGVLIFRYLVSLIDEDSNVRELAHLCLIHNLLKKFPTLFFTHFVETVFHFNDYQNHPMYNQFSQTERDRATFSLKSAPRKREQIYKIMLEHMTDEQKFHLQGKICQDILGALSDGTLVLDAAGPVLQDALEILSLKEMKLGCFKKQVDDNDEEPAAVAITAARNHILSQISKKNLMENIIPIVIELKHFLERKHSPYLRNLMLYLKDLMKEYRDEVTDILAADRQLASEVEYDLRMLEQQAAIPTTTPLTPKSPMLLVQRSSTPVDPANPPTTPTRTGGNQIFSPSRSPIGSLPRLRRVSVEAEPNVVVGDPTVSIVAPSNAQPSQTPRGTRSAIISRWRKSSPWRVDATEIAPGTPKTTNSPSFIRMQPIVQDDALAPEEVTPPSDSPKNLHKVLNFD